MGFSSKKRNGAPSRGYLSSVSQRCAGGPAMSAYIAKSRTASASKIRGASTTKNEQNSRTPDFLKQLFPSELSPEPELQRANGNAESQDIIDLTGEEDHRAVHNGFSRCPTSEQRGKPSTLSQSCRCVPIPTSSDSSSQSQQSPPASVSQNETNKIGDEAEKLLQYRLMEAEKKKNRTQFTPLLLRPPSPAPNRVLKQPKTGKGPLNFPSWQPSKGLLSNHNTDNLLLSEGSGLGWSPQGKSIDKTHSLTQRHLKECGEALSKYLAKDPQNPRTLAEIQEHEWLKEKAGEGGTLNGQERERLRTIKRNIERREYTLSRDKSSIPKKIRTPNKAKVANRGEKAEYDGEIVFDIETDNTTSQIIAGAPSESVAETPPDLPIHQISTVSHESEDESVTDDESSTEVADYNETNTAEPNIEGSDCLWQYQVYRSDAGDLRACDEPMLIATYLRKFKAEARVRREIMKISSKLWDRTRMEVRTVFEDGGFCGQALEFANGRVVEVGITRQLIEDKSQARRTRDSHLKLESLPSKVYVIFESVVDAETSSDESALDDNSLFGSTTGAVEDNTGSPLPVWKECFVLREHANAFASKRMLDHLTSHLPKVSKFDVDITKTLDTDTKLYLRDLELGERMYDRTEPLPTQGADGRKKQVTIRVMELLLRGPRN